MGEGEVAGGSRDLAGRQTHRPAGGGSSGEPVVLEYTVLRGIDYRRHASISAYRAVQCTARTLQERRLLAAEKDGCV